MSHLYVDESLHPSAGFGVAGLVWSPQDLEATLIQALETNGFDPDKDEFKSSLRMARRPEVQNLRESLFSIIRMCSVGVFVGPADDRRQFGLETVDAAAALLRNNSLHDLVAKVTFDEGLVSSGIGLNRWRTHELPAEVGVDFNGDSHQVRGLQLADLLAHAASVMLREEMGLTKKTVAAGDNSGYDPDLQIEIGFELFARLRYEWLTGGSETPESPFLVVADRGYFRSPRCEHKLAECADARFGHTYVGCIH